MESVRVEGERTVAARVQQHPLFRPLESALIPSDSNEIRRRLLAGSLRLTDTMAPVAYGAARTAQSVLGIEGELEIYQRSGGENAAIHLIESPILLEIHGRLLPLLDEGALLGLFGHELGHYLAHGRWGSLGRAHGIKGAVGHPELDDDLQRDLLMLSMLAELTADRVGLLACQDLQAMLRLEMITLTGLSGEVLTWDTEAYLAQSRELMESVLDAGDTIYGSTHPEHSLRAYALWLFSETRAYRELTGRGPATRDLDEVDALIWRFFADDEEHEQALEPGYHMLDEPPRELHECALAASVVVAFADGELADEEAEAIERIFAPLVGDWQSYLDFEVALARFRETAPVVAVAGGDLLRTLFNLLVHVMGADGVVDPMEVGAILAIGEALGCEEQYRRLLASTLSALRVSVDVEETEALDLPLPVREAEVSDAFDAFVQGVLRRGEAVITLRRLLRLLGSERRDEALIARIDQALEANEIDADTDLGDAELDERIHLVALSLYVEELEPQVVPAVEESREGLRRALTRMRDLLVSGDGRSPSVRLRRLRRGRTFDLFELDRIAVGTAERALTQIRNGRAAHLVRASEAGQHKAARACANGLKALARENRSRIEETGANDLYIGYPLLTGNVVPDGSRRTTTYLVRAPLVLFPVELVETAKGARGFQAKPRKDEPPVVNQSLLRLLFNKKGYAYPDELSDELDALAGDPTGGVDAVLAKLAEVGLAAARRPGPLAGFRERNDELEERGAFLEIEECAIFGIFPQSSSDLLQDYDGLIAELGDASNDIAELLASARVLLPDGLQSHTAGEPTVPPREDSEPGPPVVLADPSQRRVVAECRRNGATVVDGPPGTGKSQVIVNLVADALRRGERVAVVCEKRAALDVVYQRLAVLGLKGLLGLVHDVNDDRRDLYDQIAERIDEYEPTPFDEDEARGVLGEHQRCRDELESRSRLLEHRPEEAGLTAGELATLAADASVPVLEPSSSLARSSLAELRELQTAATALHPLAPLWKPGSPWRAPEGCEARESFAGWGEAELRRLEAEVASALDAAKKHERLQDRSPVPGDLVETARPGLEEARRSRGERRGVLEQRLFATVLRTAVDEPDRLRAADEARAAWEHASHALVRYERPVEMQASTELVRALSVMRHWAGRFLRFFIWGWWMARRVVKRSLASGWPERAGEPLSKSFLDELADRIAASGAWNRIRESSQRLQLQEHLPGTARDVGEFVQRLATLTSGASRLAAARTQLQAVQAWLGDREAADALAEWDRTVDERWSLLEARDELRRAAAGVRRVFPWLAELPTASELDSLLRGLRQDGQRLVELDDWRAKCVHLLPDADHVFDGLVRALPDAGADRWKHAMARTWAEGWLRRLEREEPSFGRLGTSADDAEVERRASRYEELEQEVAELEAGRVLAEADDADLLKVRPAEKYQRRTDEQKTKEQILKETRKKRRLMPLRSFVRRFADHGLLDVVPVWLLSPETMAILFPREPLFDLVIFDEASQCTVESGFPVLLRAKRVVIAGDEKQMPPSAYFALGSGDDDDEQPAEDESEQQLRDMLSAESLLTLARTRVAHAGLNWHYRCRDEALIAFSNHSMYHGELLTIPAPAGPAAESAIRWVTVEGGEYDRGENLPEAERVVDVLHELLEREQPPSIGVVTFNLRQRRAILDAIDVRSADDEAFSELWAAAKEKPLDEQPFVKNLEQVQGDERDVIVFSLGHAPRERKRRGKPTGELYVPARFGPLGQRGGERRLNVAISRAKQECVVVSSFDPSQLSVANAKNDGPKLFHRFLEFAQHMSHGRRAQADHVLDRVREARKSPHHRRRRLPIEGYTPLVTQLALALEAERVPFELDVGASEFRVPLAVLDPQDPTRFVLAVLPDEGTEPMEAFERHVHRPAVLRLRGWQVLQVTALAWRRRREEVLERIFELVPGCRGALDNDVWTKHRAEVRAARPAGPRPVQPSPRAVPPAARAAEARDTYERAGAGAPASREVPDWALAIEDPKFRKALLHLEKHGVLTETELVNMVGGARRARRFARLLDTWTPNLPFEVQVGETMGRKVYGAQPRIE